MSIRETRDRRGRSARGETGLLERDLLLVEIDRLLKTSAGGADHALLFTGHSGLGKTRLYEAALDRARARDLLVLKAAGSELERDVAFGVAGELLRSLVAAVPAGERSALLQDAPDRIRALHGEGPALGPGSAQEDLAVSHGLFALLAAAVETRPALIALDDLHWCDAASLQFVLYLLHRLIELPLALVLTSWPTEPDGTATTLDEIAAHPFTRVYQLPPLGRSAVTQMIADALGEENAEALTDVCMETTAGNPFYLHELLLALAEDRDQPVERLEQRALAMAPDAVTRAVRVRVARLGPDAAALARAVAILGDEVPLRSAAALAELELPRASAAADALASVEVLLAREPLRFVHPLVRNAIELDVPASQLAGRHLDAARLLEVEGEGIERVAAHLLRGRAEGDSWAVERLRAAADEARSRGAASSAVRYLERALAEPPPSDVRAALLTELGSAEASLGMTSAEEHLALAAEATSDPVGRAEIALVLGRALYAQGDSERAAGVFNDGLRQLADSSLDEQGRELHDRLRSGLLISAANVPGLQAEALRLSAEVMDERSDGVTSRSRRHLLAQATVNAAFSGQPADVVIDLATQAWDEGRLLEQETTSDLSWLLVTGALCLAGALELSLEAAEAAAADARRLGAPLAFATASFMRVLPQFWRGDIDGALADLELARDARRYGWRQYVRSAAAQYSLCLIEKGELERADEVLLEDVPLAPPYDGEDAIRLYVLAELRRAQGRYEEAFNIALSAGAAGEATLTNFGYAPWRSPAVHAALALGRLDRARELTEEQLERAQRTGIVRERIRALRLAGLVKGGKAGLEQLRAAVEVGEASPPRLETIYALIDLGSALRRANERTAARPPLERAADLARRGGATVLFERARVELAATGARPRREVLLSGPESLTPSERRIAELAAHGSSNREIAGALFITPKTVEYHLRNAYRKLDIQGRAELAGALGS